MTVDPGRLPAKAVEAAAMFSTRSARVSIVALFIEALLEDDAAMRRLHDTAWRTMGRGWIAPDGGRAALLAAVQVEADD